MNRSLPTELQKIDFRTEKKQQKHRDDMKSSFLRHRDEMKSMVSDAGLSGRCY